MTRFENDHASDHPSTAHMDAGTYSWCQCGKTKTIPYCDGSHEGTGIEPLMFEVKEAGILAICNCGLTATPPYCDGSHVGME